MLKSLQGKRKAVDRPEELPETAQRGGHHTGNFWRLLLLFFVSFKVGVKGYYLCCRLNPFFCYFFAVCMHIFFPLSSHSFRLSHVHVINILTVFIHNFILLRSLLPAFSSVFVHFQRSRYSGNKTEWSPIQSVIIRVITKSDDGVAGVRFVYHEYDYRLNWTTRSPIIN